MILTASAIREALRAGELTIEPFSEEQLNPNSYNLRLADQLGVYLPRGERSLAEYVEASTPLPPATLDCKQDNPAWHFAIPEEGIVLHPGKLYLAATVERTASDTYIPMIEGRSSLARLGISIHQTGGFGDVGFRGHWTLEITCVEPVRIYAGMRVCQLQFWKPYGPIDRLYEGKYVEQRDPTASRLHQELKP